MGRTQSLIRVERGRPDERELAAVVAVLLALRAGAQPEVAGEPAAAEMSWWRMPQAYTAPDGWR
ncbi:acyl-CoA carboxylase epsilon subunit [Streptomyces asoensis]|uniref:acyl-CoA carboxylase epsilon subunit n=1 Tax=Streptomyces asoensis TaxID=249586 RepID=UPI0033E34C32